MKRPSPARCAALLALGAGLPVAALGQAPLALPQLDVTAGREAPPSALIGAPPPPFAGGQVADGARIGALGNRRLLEAPFAIQSLTGEFVQDRQAQSLTDVTRFDSSTTTSASRYRYFDSLSVRGFPAQYTIDGLPFTRGIIQQLEPFDRIEVLRGPASTTLGNISGFAPGAVNLVPKRAGDVPLTELNLRYLGGAAFGTHVDIGRRFGPNNEWGVRFNGVLDRGETNIEGLSLNRNAGHLALDFRGERFRASFDLNLIDNETTGGQPGFTVAAGVPVPRAPRLDRTLGQTWTDYQRQSGFGLLRAEYDVAPDWTVGFAGSLGYGNEAGRYDGDATIINGAGDYRWTTSLSDARTYDEYALQGYLRGRVRTGPVSHNLALFATYGEESFDLNAPFTTFTVLSNLSRPVYVPDPGRRPGEIRGSDLIDRERRGLAIADEIGFLDDRVLLTLGLRETRLWSNRFNEVTGAGSRFEGSATTPLIGVTLRPTPWLSVFGNYVESLEFGGTAPSTAVNRNEPTAPFVSRQLEAGIKVESGGLGATLAVFEIERQSAFTDPASGIFAANGLQTHRGVELLGYGEVRPGLRVLGGFTYLDPVLTQTAGRAFDGNQAPDVPSWRAVATAEVDLGQVFGVLPGLSVYGGVTHSGPFYLDAANTQRVRGHTLLDLGASYRTQIGAQPVTFRLSAENVADERYWTGSRAGSLGVGTPRTVLFSTSVRF